MEHRFKPYEELTFSDDFIAVPGGGKQKRAEEYDAGRSLRAMKKNMDIFRAAALLI